MSLIQEALRRKEADTEGVPPPPVSPSGEPKKDSALKSVIAVLLVLVILIGVAVYLFTYLVSSFAPKPPAPVAETAGPMEIAVSEPAVVEPEPVAVEPVPEIAEPEIEVPAEVSEPEPVPEVLPEPEPEPVVAAEPAPAEWPSLNLTGVLRKGGMDGSAAAMIGGELVSVNETIQGVRLLSVESSGVWLEMNGEQKFLTIGRSLK